MKHLLWIVLVLPLMAWFLILPTASLIPREVLIAPPFNKSGLIIWQVWYGVIVLLYIIKQFLPKKKRLD